MNKAVFLDRDGVINKKRNDYVKNIDEFVFLKDVPKAIRLLNGKKFLVIIITNQSAINRGFLTHEELNKIHSFMTDKLERENAFVDAIYYCPHRPDQKCFCRKPNTELIKNAINEYSISTKSSWFIGDSESDILAANRMDIYSIKINENGSLLDAVKTICGKLPSS